MKLRAATEIARSVDHIAWFATEVSVALVLLVTFLLVYFSIKYRKGSKADRSNRKEYSVTIELLSISAMLVFGLGLFFWSARVFYREYSAPKNALDLYVLGKQWMWVFQYPDGPQEIGRIKVPINQPVRLLLSSDDVIHSFYLPEFRLKQDALPGRYTSLWIEPQEPGEYDVLCAEFCGTSHSAMRATIEAVSAEEFAAYRLGKRDPRQEGSRVYQKMACATCHESGGKIAPVLAGVYGRKITLTRGFAFADENYLRRSLLEPAKEIVRGYRPLMPTYKGLLTEPEINALVQYIKSLHKDGAP